MRVYVVLDCPLGPAVVRGEERRLDELVQPVEVDVRQEGLTTPPLRRAAQRRVEPPVLQISGLEQVLDQPQEAVVVDLLAQDRQQDLMVQTVEACAMSPSMNQARALPRRGRLAQRGVAPAAGPEAVGVVGELRLVVGLQDRAG